MGLGAFPEVKLAEAHERPDEARRLMRDQVNPMDLRKQQRLQKRASDNTFQHVADEWFSVYMPKKSATHQDRTQRILDKDLLPVIGAMGIKDIKAPDVLQALRRIEARGAVPTTHMARQAEY